jgi:hypothetical protein
MSGQKGQRGPYTFRCGKCKRGGSCHRNRNVGTNWRATGTIKGKRAQYECLDCGHFGWSNHESVIAAASTRNTQR